MNGAQLRQLLDGALETLQLARDELRDLDAAIGDGDLGITVAEGAEAAREGLSATAETVTPVQVLRTVAQQFASANPSTMSGLVATALLAGSTVLESAEDLNREGATELLYRAIAKIQERGLAEVGDKTIVDALVPSLQALRSAGPDDRAALAAMTAAAQDAVITTTGLRSRRGRAAWVGERTIGAADGGATAYLRLLQALELAWPAALDGTVRNPADDDLPEVPASDASPAPPVARTGRAGTAGAGQ